MSLRGLYIAIGLIAAACSSKDRDYTASGGKAGSSSSGGAGGTEQGSSGDSGASGSSTAGASGSSTAGGSAGSGVGGDAGMAGDSGVGVDEAPVPGDSGTLAASNVTFTKLTLSWTEASDDITPVTELEYRVYRSLANNLQAPEDLEGNGTALGDFQAGTTSAEVTLEPGVDNYFNVAVRDGADNLAVYAGYFAEFVEAPSCTDNTDCFSGTCTISYLDADGDGYGIEDTVVGRCDNSIPVGYSLTAGDCCDDGGNLETAALIFPGQEDFFYQPASICGISWDYDCSGEPEKEQLSRPVSCTAQCQAIYELQSYLECGMRYGACSCAIPPGGTTCTVYCPTAGPYQQCH